MSFDEYHARTVQIADKFGVSLWLSVELADGHCSFHGYPENKASDVIACTQDLAAFRANNWV